MSLMRSSVSLINGLSLIVSNCNNQIRGNVRWFFEKPSEIKRIRKYGWNKRISTQNGKNIIMRRILKGRHILSH
jgi:ribosomal protein L34